MKPLHLVTLILLIVGGLNWGLVGLSNFDLVATLFGAGSILARIVYMLVGLSALWQLVPLFLLPSEVTSGPRYAGVRLTEGRCPAAVLSPPTPRRQRGAFQIASGAFIAPPLGVAASNRSSLT